MSKNSPKKSGCFISCLKIFAIFIGLPFLFVFGWIAGIIWLLFFRRKMEGTTIRRKIITILVSILSVFSLAFFIYAASSPSPSDDGENLADATVAHEQGTSSEDITNAVDETILESTATSTFELTVTPTPKPTATPTPVPTVTPTSVPTTEPTVLYTYVLNTNTKKIHYADCYSAAQIKPKNYATWEGASYLDFLATHPGYSACKNCIDK